MKHPHENEAHDKHGSKNDELKSYIEEKVCSRDKTLEELCGNLFKKFRKQIELQFTNELKK